MPASAYWIDGLLEQLQASGPEGADTARYLREHHVRLGFRQQPTAARWTLGRGIDLHPRYAQGTAQSAYALSLLIHEAQHLRQGIFIALSVYGELEAWQSQFRFLGRMTEDDRAAAPRPDLIDQLLRLPLSWDRTELGRARNLMQAYAGPRYRVDLLPLYPLPREILYALAPRTSL
ncbi:MAG TPA: hypothetical protein VIU38_11615 [Anaerolineales bacterium]